MSLNAQRQIGMDGPLLLPHAEIFAWCQLTGIELVAWELAAVKAMDGRFVRGEVKMPQPITSKTFKAMFGKGG